MAASSDANAARLQHELADKLRAAGTIVSPAVESAFRTVPRHLFLPGVPVDDVYRDAAVTTKRVDGVALSSSSQPSIMATMLEQLDLQPGHSVLEIGAGTGYNAALMAHIVGDAGQVVTVDIDDDIVAAANQNLARARIRTVHAVAGDGGLGWPRRGPYDRIIVTVGAWDIMPAWWDQLRLGGRLVVPLWLSGGQKSIAFDETDGHLQSRSLRECGFILLRGTFAGPEGYFPIASVPDLTLVVDDGSRVDPSQVAEWLGMSPAIRATGLSLRGSDLEGATFWLALHEPSFTQFWQTGDGVKQRPFSALRVLPDGSRGAMGIVASDGLCVLTVSPEDSPLGSAEGEATAVAETVVQIFGTASDLGNRVLSHLTAWHNAGRPSLQALDIQAYPMAHPREANAGEVWVDKRWSRLLVHWRTAT